MNTTIVALIIGFILGFAGGLFVKSLNKKIVLNYLLYAVAIAEKEFGSGTGKLKLAKVYNNFIKDMPIVAKLFSYDSFCKLVDQALIKLQELLKNDNIDNIIKGIKKE